MTSKASDEAPSAAASPDAVNEGGSKIELMCHIKTISVPIRSPGHARHTSHALSKPTNVLDPIDRHPFSELDINCSSLSPAKPRPNCSASANTHRRPTGHAHRPTPCPGEARCGRFPFAPGPAVGGRARPERLTCGCWWEKFTGLLAEQAPGLLKTLRAHDPDFVLLDGRLAAFPARAKVWFAAHGSTHIHRVVTDNGACHRSGDFARIVGKQFRHQRTKPHTPRHNGKVERYQRILAEELLYARDFISEDARSAAITVWTIHYNSHRPHSGAGGQTPASDCGKTSPTSAPHTPRPRRPGPAPASGCRAARGPLPRPTGRPSRSGTRPP